MRKSSGRPLEVEGGQRCSILFGKKELRIIAEAERRQLSHRDSSSRSAVVRQMVRLSWAEHRDDLQEIWKKELAIQELERRLEKEAKARLRAEKEAQQARSRAKGSGNLLNRLLAHLPMVRDRAASGLAIPSGVPLLDQIWHNSGRSWAQVLVKLEVAQRQQDPLNPDTVATK